MTRILVGTSDGLHVFEYGRAPEVQRIGWEADADGAVTALARAGSEVWAIVDRREIWRAGEDGWSHVVSQLDLQLHCLADTRAGMIVGTSEAHLLRIANPPTPLETIAGFEQVVGRDGWYTPWGGPPDTRSISEDDDTVYVNVHVGGIARSVDEGASWEPTIDVDADVHRVWAGTPWVFAACAGGLAVSSDRGQTWTIRSEGLEARYCRGVALCGDTVLVSASQGPRGGRAAVYRGSPDAGPLERCRDGLPEWFEDNIDSSCLDATPDLVAFGTGDGRVFASTDEGATWSAIAVGLTSIECVLVMP